jgi:hypothetical protein
MLARTPLTEIEVVRPLNAFLRDSDLLERPHKGWTPWRDGAGEHKIEHVWWQARVLHFPKLNCSAWFDGSEHVGIELWGYHGGKWTMKKPPSDWQPMPAGHREAAEHAWLDWASNSGKSPARRVASVARGEVPLPNVEQR